MESKAAVLQRVNPSNRIHDYSFGMDILGEAALVFEMNDKLAAGLRELVEIEVALQNAGYVDVIRKDGRAGTPFNANQVRIQIDPSVVRGLEYYTGAEKH